MANYRDVLARIGRLNELAANARALGKSEQTWDTQAAIHAENEFTGEAYKELTPRGIREYEAYALKATGDERIDKLLQLLGLVD